MLCLTNYARIHSGLKRLVGSPTLDQAGEAKLDADLNCGEFSHTPCSKPFEEVFAAYLTGATAYTLGENIAWGTGSFGTPRQTMNGWLHSTEHLQNIHSPAFHELGIGYLAGQAFRFTALSWRRFYPSGTPVTILYSDLIASLLGRLRHVRNWNADVISTSFRTSRWFL